jgi:hypothetical protein
MCVRRPLTLLLPLLLLLQLFAESLSALDSSLNQPRTTDYKLAKAYLPLCYCCRIITAIWVTVIGSPLSDSSLTVHPDPECHFLHPSQAASSRTAPAATTVVCLPV